MADIAQTYKGFTPKQYGKPARPSAVIEDRTGEALMGFMQSAGMAAQAYSKFDRDNRIIKARQEIGAKGVEHFVGENFKQSDMWVKHMVAKDRTEEAVRGLKFRLENTLEFDSMSPDEFSKEMDIETGKLRELFADADDGGIADNVINNVLYDQAPIIGAMQAKKYADYIRTQSKNNLTREISSYQNIDLIQDAIKLARTENKLTEQEIFKSLRDAAELSINNGIFTPEYSTVAKMNDWDTKFTRDYVDFEESMQNGYNRMYERDRSRGRIAAYALAKEGRLGEDYLTEFEERFPGYISTKEREELMIMNNNAIRQIRESMRDYSAYGRGEFIASNRDRKAAENEYFKRFISGVDPNFTPQKYANLIAKHAIMPSGLSTMLTSVLNSVNSGQTSLDANQTKALQVLSHLSSQNSQWVSESLKSDAARITWNMMQTAGMTTSSDLSSVVKIIRDRRDDAKLLTRRDIQTQYRDEFKSLDADIDSKIADSFESMLTSQIGFVDSLFQDATFNKIEMKQLVQDKTYDLIQLHGVDPKTARDTAIQAVVNDHEIIDNVVQRRFGGKTFGERAGFANEGPAIIKHLKDTFTEQLKDALPGVDLRKLKVRTISDGIIFHEEGNISNAFPIPMDLVIRTYAVKKNVESKAEPAKMKLENRRVEDKLIKDTGIWLRHRTEFNVGAYGSETGMETAKDRLKEANEMLKKYEAMDRDQKLKFAKEQRRETGRQWRTLRNTIKTFFTELAETLATQGRE